MFWRISQLSASPVDTVLDKENFTLEELLDEEEIIQECKALNSRLINFLRDRAQVKQLLRYIIEEQSEGADSKRVFKLPFVACEIFTCEIDVILRTLVEEEELMDLLFSFLEPTRPHSASLAGYFSKVVVCLMTRKMVPLMNYVQVHQDVFCHLVDLIGITSIMEVLVRLVGADDHVYPNMVDVMQWLAESNLLEMIVDKLSPSSSPEVQANAAETLCAITRNTGSVLAMKLSSPSSISRIWALALEDLNSKSALVHSLSVCISLLDPRRSASSLLIHSLRGQHMYEAPTTVNPETVSAMLPKLGDLLLVLNVTSNEKVLPTPYGELKPPLGKHRLKIVEFVAVLLKAGAEAAESELVNSGTIKRMIDLFFEYPYNNALHHHVESIISSCLESRNSTTVDHLFSECDLIGKMLQVDKHSVLSTDSHHPTVSAAGKKAPRAGNIGHITRISNRIIHLAENNSHIQTFIQENDEWTEWQSTVLQERNAVENVYRWSCGRPTPLHDRTRDSDDDDIHDEDYDVAALANSLSQAFSTDLFGAEAAEEENGVLDRDDEDVFFDNESAEVVISSLRLGNEQGSLFTNSDWFSFRDERIESAPASTSLSVMMDEINLNGSGDCDDGSSDDEVVLGEDEELTDTKDLTSSTSGPSGNPFDGVAGSNSFEDIGLSSGNGFSLDLFGERPDSDSMGWSGASDTELGGSSLNPFLDHDYPIADSIEVHDLPNGNSTAPSSVEVDHRTGPSLFEEDVEFVGVEPEGTEKAMEQALKEGTVGEAGPLKSNINSQKVQDEACDGSTGGLKEFNDANYWRIEQEVAVLE
ncbi:Serine/threonine-protein phosphatase 6 regulatory subunit 3-like protein [Drosera capensis]